MMDDERLLAWIDGELEPAEAEAVAAAVAGDPALAARAEAHRKLKARIAAAFGPLLDQTMALPPRRLAPVVSLAAARAQRQEREAARKARDAKPRRRRWAGFLAAGLLAAMLVVHQISDGALDPSGRGIRDHPAALALAPDMAAALDGQTSGQAGPLRVSLSFRDKTGAYCRSFMAEHLDGVACHVGDGWRLRYAGHGRAAESGAVTMQVVQTMISGKPLDAAQERAARAAGWK